METYIMGGKGSGPKPQHHDAYHVILREMVRKSRAKTATDSQK